MSILESVVKWVKLQTSARVTAVPAETQFTLQLAYAILFNADGCV